MPLEKESLNNFLPDGFETNNLEGYKENFSADKIATGYEKDVKDRVSGPNFNNLLDVIGKNTNVLTKFMDFIKNMPVNNLFAVDENNQLVYKNLDEVGGGGLEIGDIGIAPLGIDESKGKRRYLNGQIILQEPYQSFTAKLKEAVALYPSLACTESEWQTTATMTVGGQVGKFVVDNDAGTIRLPKIIMPIQGLTDLSKLAEIVEAGLPNMSLYTPNSNDKYGSQKNVIYNIGNTSGNANNILGTIHPDKVFIKDDNNIVGNSNTVQQEQIQYPYFIQVATGSETEDNIINEIELNNPFSLLDYKFSEYELNNLSWLRSNGQYNSKAIYPAVYDLLLKIYNGTETKAGVSVKLHTDTSATDYDFRINTAEETFRLPIKVKLPNSKGVAGNGMATGYTNGTDNFGMFLGVNDNIIGSKNAYGQNVGDNCSKSSAATYDVRSAGITTDSTKSGIEVKDDSSIYLYFYVGETVQNANLINAGRIEETLATKVNMQQATVASMPSNRYIDLTLGASGTTYTAPANGWVYVYMYHTDNSKGWINIVNNTNGMEIRTGTRDFTSGIMPVLKGDVYHVSYDSNTLSDKKFRFYYAEGEK